MVRRKWIRKHKNKGGRLKISQETEGLIVRLVKENSRWGYGKIEGELLKLEFKVSQTTIRNVHNRYGIVPASVHNGSIGWRHLMKHYKEQKRVLKSYKNYYETARPHQGLNQQMPIPRKNNPNLGPIRKREVLGGVINDYDQAPYSASVFLN